MQVLLTNEAQKQLDKIPKTSQKKIVRKLMLLEVQSYSGKKLSGEYRENRSLRAWPYRIIYLVKEKKRKVWIVTILHRQGAYK